MMPKGVDHKKKSMLDKFLEDPESARLFCQEQMILAMTELVCRELDEKNLSRKQLANKMGISAVELSEMLEGGENFTIRAFSDMLFFLDKRVWLGSRKRKNKV
jgi:predicted XRE-type DNA-binding protein